MDTARVFWSGRSQAVCLPKAYRIEGDRVRIRRRGDAIILEPIPPDWSWLDALSGGLDEDFCQAAGQQPLAEERPELSEFFARR
ncbi:MAG: type II toxin-antitoxin system VapB family antitoxin [Thiobacillaceae bacterium]|nr:type II toxin-antitoxin system VapB family antitoxin [Thiobacillaceae bacterium]